MIGERIRAMIADKGYDADAIREELNFNGIEAVAIRRRGRRRWRSVKNDTWLSACRPQSLKFTYCSGSSIFIALTWAIAS
jgi:transposase